MSRFAVLAVALCVLGCPAETVTANPIRKVVGMLQDMQKQVEKEGETEKDLFDKFMCYCNNGASALDASIQTAASQIESLTGKIETESAQKSQFTQDVAQHKTDRSEAEKTVKESTAMRGKEASEFSATSGELKANIEAMGGALAALKKGLSASMLQTSAGQTLRNIVEHSPAVSETERSTLMSFLESGEGGSDQIIGIVATMKEEMEADLKEATSTEEEAKASFATLTASKEKEIAAAGKAIEEKTARSGELAVSVVQAKADLEDTEEAKADDETFKANLAASCATKSKEWDERQKIRAEEVTAISETIEMLNGDDALELFKKTLPSAASFLQLTTRTQQQSAAAILRKIAARNPKRSINLRTVLAMLQSHTGGPMGKVVEMIDGMISNHGKDQAADDSKKDFCVSEIDATEDAEKVLKGAVADSQADIAEREDSIATLASEIEALEEGLAALDKSVAQATEQRKEEHAEYTATSAANSAALELIGMAKNRMNKFYAPSQYEAPETTTESSSPYGFVQLSAHRAAPGEAPETFSGEYKKSESSGGVMAMMDQMMKDVEMDLQSAKHDEADAQKDYEETMKDAASKREEDSKLMVEKGAAKAEQVENLQNARAELATKRDQLGITQGKLDDVHRDCDYLLANYDEIKKNRATEVDGLKEAKATLAGASSA